MIVICFKTLFFPFFKFLKGIRNIVRIQRIDEMPRRVPATSVEARSERANTRKTVPEAPNPACSIQILYLYSVELILTFNLVPEWPLRQGSGHLSALKVGN